MQICGVFRWIFRWERFAFEGRWMGQRIDFSLVIGKPAEAVAVAWFLGGTLGWVSLECRITDCSRNLINEFALFFFLHTCHAFFLRQETQSKRIKWFMKKYEQLVAESGFCRLKSLASFEKKQRSQILHNLATCRILARCQKKMILHPWEVIKYTQILEEPFFCLPKIPREVHGQRFAVNHLAALFVPCHMTAWVGTTLGWDTCN